MPPTALDKREKTQIGHLPLGAWASMKRAILSGLATFLVVGAVISLINLSPFGILLSLAISLPVGRAAMKAPPSKTCLLWLAVAVGVVVIALLMRQSDIAHQEEQQVRIQAEQQHRQLEAERREIEQLAPQVCPDLSTQKQCMEETEAACGTFWDLPKRKECMVTSARWCLDERTRKQCIADTLQAQEEARRAEQVSQQEQARRAQQAQHEAWCATVEQQVPEVMERWPRRAILGVAPTGLSVSPGLPQERAIDRYLLSGH